MDNKPATHFDKSFNKNVNSENFNITCMDFTCTDPNGEVWQFSEPKNCDGMPIYTRIVAYGGVTPYQLKIDKRFVAHHNRTFTFQYKTGDKNSREGKYIHQNCNPKNPWNSLGCSMITNFEEAFAELIAHHKLMIGDY